MQNHKLSAEYNFTFNRPPLRATGGISALFLSFSVLIIRASHTFGGKYAFLNKNAFRNAANLVFRVR